VKRLHFERLMRYHRVLTDWAVASDVVASEHLAKHCGVDPTQVRKDLAALGLRGKPSVGFTGATVLAAIRERLGLDTLKGAVIVGSGRMARALADYPLFSVCGLAVVAIFDDDIEATGEVVAGASLYPLKALPRECRRLGVRLGIITPSRSATPKEAMQALVEAGVRAIWNFTPATLVAPPGVLVRDEQLSVDLAELAYAVRDVPEAR